MSAIVGRFSAACHVAFAALTCLAIEGGPIICNAQNYPVKPIRLIVAFPAGGPADVSARNLASLLAPRLGRQIIIENRPGASGTIGTKIAAGAAPDGYTLLYCNVARHSANVALFPDLAYDPAKEFTPIVRFATAPFVLLVNTSFAVRTLGELTTLAKAQPAKIRYGSAGVATFICRQRAITRGVWGSEFVAKGGMMSHAPDIPEVFRRAAVYVDTILRGAKPAELPIEQPTKFELAVNLKTAKALGITIPEPILLRADKVIQ